MTKKQLQQARVETHSEMYGLLLDLDYSIDLLDDYRSDLQTTAKETTQMIKKARAKFKRLQEQYEKSTGKKYNPRKR